MSRLRRSSRFEKPGTAGSLVLSQHREQDRPGYSPDDVVTVDQYRPVGIMASNGTVSGTSRRPGARTSWTGARIFCRRVQQADAHPDMACDHIGQLAAQALTLTAS
jgi:hypothetical protein